MCLSRTDMHSMKCTILCCPIAYSVHDTHEHRIPMDSQCVRVQWNSKQCHIHVLHLRWVGAGTDSPERLVLLFKQNLLQTERRWWCSKKYEWPRNPHSLSYSCYFPELAKKLYWKWGHRQRKTEQPQVPYLCSYSLLISRPTVEGVGRMSRYQRSE